MNRSALRSLVKAGVEAATLRDALHAEYKQHLTEQQRIRDQLRRDAHVFTGDMVDSEGRRGALNGTFKRVRGWRWRYEFSGYVVISPNGNVWKAPNSSKPSCKVLAYLLYNGLDYEEAKAGADI